MDWLYYAHYSPSTGEHELTSEELRWHESPPVDGRCCIIHKRGVANTRSVCVCLGARACYKQQNAWAGFS